MWSNLDNVCQRRLCLRRSLVVKIVALIVASAVFAPQANSWEHTWGTPSQEIAGGIATDSTGATYCCFQSGTPTEEYHNLLKFDSAGTLLWSRSYDVGLFEYSLTVTCDDSGSVYTAGAVLDTVSGDLNCLIVKWDSAGALLWQRSLGESHQDVLYAVTTDSHGDVFAAGYSEDTLGDNRILLLKYRKNGQFEWARLWQPPNIFNSATSIDVGTNGKIHVVGNITYLGPPRDDRMLVLQYDTSGALDWVIEIDNGGSEDIQFFNALATTTSGELYIAGVTMLGGNQRDGVVMKLAPDGSLLWSRVIGGTSDDRFNALALTGTGNVLVAGRTSSFGVSAINIILCELDPMGNAVSQGRWQCGSGNARAYTVAVHRDRIVIGGGSPNPSGSWNELTASPIALTPSISVVNGTEVVPLAVETALTGMLSDNLGTLDLGAGGPDDAFLMTLDPPCQPFSPCECHADPAGCDGVQDVTDVVQTINVAFRGAPASTDPNVNCPLERTDVNCTSSTDVLDVVKMVNVAFRGANPATEFCKPCAP